MGEDEHAVANAADTETPESSVEGGGAQDDDLETLLNQWEAQAGDSDESQQSSESSSDQSQDEIAELRKRVERQERERAQQQTQQDVQEAASKMRQAVSDEIDISEDIWEDILHGRASRDPRVVNAWNARREKPEEWEKLTKAIAKDYVKRLRSNVDKSATEDRDAVASAVRSASKAPAQDSGAPSESDLNNMSDAEFNRLTRGLR